MANLSNINNKFIVTDGGNVLIGTTADVAAVRLQVKNAGAAAVLRLTGGSDSWDFDTYYTDNKLFIKSSGAAGTVMTLLGASGNVGLKTDSPVRHLQLQTKNGARNYGIGLNDKDSIERGTIAVDVNTNNLITATTGSMQFFTGSNLGSIATLPTNEAMRIDSDQNVRTYAKLGIRVDGDAIPWNGTAQIPAVINLAGNGALFTRPDYTYLSQNFYYDSSDTGAVIDAGQASVIELSGGDIRFYGSTTGAANAAISLRERIRITSDGNLTFAKSADSNRAANSIKHADNDFLYIVGGAAGVSLNDDGEDTRIILFNNSNIRFDAGTKDNAMIIQGNTGNVGIGYTSPGSQLSIYKTAFGGDTAGSGGTLDFGVGSTKYWQFRLDSSSSGDLAIDKTYSNVWTTPVTIQRSSGNVGIGLPSPTARLNVSGIGQANNPTVAIDVTNSDSFNHGLEIFDGNLTTGETVLMAIGQSGSTKLTAIFGFVRNESSLDQNLATIGFWGADNKLTVAAGGNVGIGTGTAVPGAKLDVRGTGNFLGTAASGAPLVTIENNSGSTATSYGLLVKGGGNSSSGKTFEVRDSSGNTDFIIKGDGTSTFTTTLVLNDGLNLTNAGANTISASNANNGYLRFVVDQQGLALTLNANATATFQSTVTGTNFILSSDERLKENIKILEPKVISTEWKTFNVKDSDEGYRVGVIAQELEVKHPEFVETNEEGFKSVKYIDLLISKIAELEHRIKQLEK